MNLESHVDLAALPKEERLSRMRHSAAHVLAEAMVELFPDAELLPLIYRSRNAVSVNQRVRTHDAPKSEAPAGNGRK